MIKYGSYLILLLILYMFFGVACAQEEKLIWHSMEVTASAYNSTRSQTNDQPNLAAWGDTLRPGMRSIAVSRDLLECGLKYNTPVKLEGFEGIYLVKDKMHHRWQNRIDIYMGEDVEKAREWGRRKLIIQYGLNRQDLDAKEVE